MTLLEIVNKVLRKLREDQVTTLDDDYSALVAEFVADAHRIVVEAHDWSSMDVTVTLPVNVGQTTYSLYEGSADLYLGSPAPTQDSILRYADNGLPLAYLFEEYADIANGDPLHQMQQGTPQNVRQDLMERVGTSARPSTFAVSQDAANEGLILTLDTSPDAQYYLTIDLHKPEAEIDTTDPAAVIRAPWRPIYLGALYFALNERGEELGEPGNTAETKFSTALASAKEADLLNQIQPNRFEFYRD